MEVDARIARELAVGADPTDAQFRLLVESVSDYAIYLLDPTGRVASWNAGAERIKGYAAAEVMGRHFSIFFTAEDRAGIIRAFPRSTRSVSERPSSSVGRAAD